MRQDDILKESEIRLIKKLVGEKRRELGYINTPIGCDIFSILDTLQIELLEYPVDSGHDRQSFSAVILHVNHDMGDLTFIGLNSADYYDNQIFAIAHELYHFFVKTSPHLCRIEDSQSTDKIEVSANRFAAEFLLPEESLRDLILDEFNSTTLYAIEERSILRLTARIQCRWWVPYRMVINRFNELGIISIDQYHGLYEKNIRDLNSPYGKIGQATHKDIFAKLNTRTFTIGTSPKNIELMIRNFEDQIIGEDEFFAILPKFSRSPAEFGYERIISDQDLEEFDAFLSEEQHES